MFEQRKTLTMGLGVLTLAKRKKKVKKPKKIKIRNLEAVSAFLRPAPKFKHKTEPKQGSKNWRDLRDD